MCRLQTSARGRLQPQIPGQCCLDLTLLPAAQANLSSVHTSHTCQSNLYNEMLTRVCLGSAVNGRSAWEALWPTARQGKRSDGRSP